MLDSAFLAGATVILRKVFWNDFSIEIITQAVISGILTACMLEFFLFRFVKFLRNRLTNGIREPELSMDEKPVLTSVASHFKGVEAVGGKLTLTDLRLIFTSHKLNIQNHRQEFLLTEIVDIKPDPGTKYHHMFWVTVTGDDVHRFAVEEPSRWIRLISKETQRSNI